MLDRTNQIALAKAAAKASLNPSVAYTFANKNMTADALEKTFMNELQELGKTPHDFDRNKNTIFELLEVALT